MAKKKNTTKAVAPSLELKFTGKVTMILDLEGYGPMIVTINDKDVVRDCTSIITKYGADMNTDTYETTVGKVARALLPE